jgi:hypothetical protein
MVLRPLVPGAKKRIRALLESSDPEIALKTATMIFQYVFGKPTERRELTGADGGAIKQETLVQDAQRLANAFTEQPVEVNGEVPSGKLTGDLLEAAKVVAFGAELAKRSNGVATLEVSSVGQGTAPPHVHHAEAPGSHFRAISGRCGVCSGRDPE